MKKERRKLIKFSNYSLCVTLPKWVLKDLSWEKGDLVDMSVDAKKGTILISKSRDSVEIKNDSAAENEQEQVNEARW